MPKAPEGFGLEPAAVRAIAEETENEHDFYLLNIAKSPKYEKSKLPNTLALNRKLGEFCFTTEYGSGCGVGCRPLQKKC